MDEQVDEDEVEAQGSHQRYLLCGLTCIFCHGKHLLNLLCIPSGESYEDQNTEVVQDHAETTALQEDVHDGGNDRANQSHKEYASD